MDEVLQKKKRFLLVLPLLVLPFVAVVAWIFLTPKSPSNPKVVQGNLLNTQIPDAEIPPNTRDKLGLYELSDNDSLERESQKRNDPSWKDTLCGDPLMEPASVSNTGNNEVLVNEKIAAITRELKSSQEPGRKKEGDWIPRSTSEDETLTRPAHTISSLTSNTNFESDPEMNQLDNMLEKVLDIQHPDRIKEKIRNSSLQNNERVFPVPMAKLIVIDPYLGKPLTKSDSIANANHKSAFHSFNTRGEDDQVDNAVTAVIHGTQTVVTGGMVKIRTTQDFYIHGKLIPHGTFLWGTANLNMERLLIHVDDITYKNSTYPVDLSVYSKTGLGISVPGATSRDAAKQGADNAISTLQMASLDPSLPTQAASAGIETVKSFLSRKAKLIHVTLKADDSILLVNSK